jgi:dolichyl-phosphate beta-glucosyltransferase
VSHLSESSAPAQQSGVPLLGIDLSIVIPAFEEGTKIAGDVEAAATFLTKAGLTGEIIVVDDGSRDDTADKARSAQVPAGAERRVIRYEPNRGKGYAVRTGVLASRGQFVMFADSGLCVPFDNALSGLRLIKDGTCDIAHGSRKLGESIITRPQRLHRRVLSRAFRWFASGLVGIPRELTDTQCGFKVYRGDVARELYGKCLTDGFMFDIEILLRAQKKGYRIAEFPVLWCSDHDSRLRPLHASFRSLVELLAIKRSLRRQGKPEA